MSYTSTPIQQKEIWESAVHSFVEANFLQSWNWGVFNEALGKEVYRQAIYEDGQLKALIQAVREPARRGAYLAVAGGPLADWEDASLMREVFQVMRQLADRSNSRFVRFRPQVFDSDAAEAIAKTAGSLKAPMHLTADLTLQLRLDQTEDEILAQMRKNTRSAIRKAASLGIITQLTSDLSEMKEFCHWQQHLAKKHKFIPFSDRFLTEQFRAFAADGQVQLVKASLDDKLLAAAFVIFYNGEAVYHYGVSTPENDHQPGSYACQWAAILEAQRRGCHRYNFWGVAPEDATQHRFAGVSLFKRGFGGQEIQYLHAHDLPTSIWYWVTYIFEVGRRKLRRL
jgi:lipid II:glycine glycyltransferase (peptidoglycan interpeptide bridge formation enzyme)